MDSAQRLSEFVAVFGGEIGTNFGEITEGTHYSAEALLTNFPDEFDAKTAADWANKPEALNIAYAHKNGNGGVESGDGLKYIGRGLTNLTGRSEYQAFTDWYNNSVVGHSDLYPNLPQTQQDFVTNPSLVASNLNIATVEGLWDFAIHNNRGNNLRLADDGNLGALTHFMTGAGYKTQAYKDDLKARQAILNKSQKIICPDDYGNAGDPNNLNDNMA
jgi:predicted chitinase